ncbi:MAG: excinuclease ABC subunit UvrC [Myxococcota bacterium]
MAASEFIRRKLDTLPTSCGVYVFHGAQGVVLYVGKARNLRSRVRSYFTPSTSDVRAFVSRLDLEMADIETFIVETEKEAALLENQLIKQHQPKYNVKLRDDKEYLSLRLSPKAEWPRLEVVRRPKQDGAWYFGPYHASSDARKTLKLVNRYFQLRTCSDAEMNARKRPCLQYQIKRCPAPCVRDVDREVYDTQVRNVARFLNGQHETLIRDLTGRMEEAARRMAYEEAAQFRDQLRAVERMHETQRVSVVKNIDQDVVGLFRQGDQAEVALLSVRNGRLVGVQTFDLRKVAIPNEEVLASFLRLYYQPGTFVPQELILPESFEAFEGLQAILSEQKGKNMQLLTPKRGPRMRLLEMAGDNAKHAFLEKRRAEEDIEHRLKQIQERLRLPRLPRHIECIDISHTGGEDAVSVIACLYDGAPARKRYRSFRIKEAQGGDDYGSIREVLRRRFRRGKSGEPKWDMPDLMVVDGGPGQLNIASAVLRELEIDTVPAVGLAKERERVSGEKMVDRVYLPGQKNAVEVRSNAALVLLSLVRDEAHRASNVLRTRVAKTRKLRSKLDGIPGVGPKTKQRLLQQLGTIEVIAAASTEELQQAGASLRQCKAIQAHFETGQEEHEFE